MEPAEKQFYIQGIQELALRPGAISLGRADDNDVIITDKSVSAHHARIFTYFNTSYIADLESTNGTYLNNKKVYKHIIHPGDIIQLGHHTLKIIPNKNE